MGRALLLGVLFAVIGCQSQKGSLSYRERVRPDDPMISIEEQQRRGREQLSVIEDDKSLTPNAFVDRPGVLGR